MHWKGWPLPTQVSHDFRRNSPVVAPLSKAVICSKLKLAQFCRKKGLEDDNDSDESDKGTRQLKEEIYGPPEPAVQEKMGTYGVIVPPTEQPAAQQFALESLPAPPSLFADQPPAIPLTQPSDMEVDVTVPSGLGPSFGPITEENRLQISFPIGPPVK